MTDLDDRLYGLLDQMRTNEEKKAKGEGRDYHIHGLCAILGYNPKEHASYFKIPNIGDVGEDLFKDGEMSLDHPEALAALQQGMEQDGAILIDKNGKFLHSGKFMCPNLREIYSARPDSAAIYNKIKETHEGGTRHLNAIALSAQLPELLFYTLKSDHPQLRVFKSGSVLRSTVPGEAKYEAPILYSTIPEF